MGLTSQGAGQGKDSARILIVDDDDTSVRLFSVLLAKEGYDVLSGASGNEAVAKALAESPDLILLDVRMPDVDGYEATRRLKSDPRTRGIPIILVTAYDDPGTKLKGLEAGADEFLPKPVDRAELLIRIRSMLRLRKYEEQVLIHKASPASGLDAPAKGETAEPGTRRVLVMLDDLRERDRVSSHLEREGYDVSSVAGGESRPSSESGVDVVIVDSSISQELLGRMRGETDGIASMAIVPSDEPESRVRLLHWGVSELLVRPFDPRELALRLDRMLKHRDALTALEQRYRTALSAAANDSMTNLYNHGYFARFFDVEIKRSLRHNHKTSVIMLDIDDFKSKNDTLGHAAGDAILIEVAERIRRSVREIDLAARYGGEEFAVVLPYADRTGAAVVAERIRMAIASEEFPIAPSGSRVAVSVSIGVAVCPDDGQSSADLLQLADGLMYEAKKAGKNRVHSRH
jgi:two-component system cell cycle response regulator